MKKSLLFLLFALASFASFSQSGESSSLKIEYTGTANGYNVITVTNKQSCVALINLQSGFVDRYKYISGNAADTVLLPNLDNKVRVKPYTNCDGQSNMGTVQISVNSVLALITPEQRNNAEKKLKLFVVYPNPFVSKVKIANPNKVDKFYIYDRFGVVVAQANANKQDTEVDLSTLSSGTYFASNGADRIQIIKR